MVSLCHDIAQVHLIKGSMPQQLYANHTFFTGRKFEYRDNYYSFPETAYIIEFLTAFGYLVNMTTIETTTILLLVQEKIK